MKTLNAEKKIRDNRLFQNNFRHYFRHLLIQKKNYKKKNHSHLKLKITTKVTRGQKSPNVRKIPANRVTFGIALSSRYDLSKSILNWKSIENWQKEIQISIDRAERSSRLFCV